MTEITSAIASIKAAIHKLNAEADAARPDYEPNTWPEREEADAKIVHLNRALANLAMLS